MGNYVIGVGNYVIVSPSQLGNYKIADSLAREQRITMVLVTHDVRVAAYADREVIVRDGVVTVDAGTVRT